MYLAFSQVISFNQSVPISTYLVCFVVSDFQSVNGQTSDGSAYPFFFLLSLLLPLTETGPAVAVRVWSTPGTVHQCTYALDCAVNVLGNLTRYFDIPYPLPKMDLVAIPEYAP